MRASRLILACAAPTVLAAVLAGAVLVRAPHVSASLYDLVGVQAKRIPSFLREASASEVSVIVSSQDRAKAEAAARTLAKAFPVSDDLPPGALAFVRDNRYGLVTRETADLLRTPAGRAKVAKRSVRRLYASPLPPLLGFEDDPFGLTDAWILSLGPSCRDRTAEGWPCLETNGVTRILLRHRLDPAIARSLDGTIACLGRLEGAARRLATEDVGVRFAGAPVHTAVSARRSKVEIGALTWFSLAFIAALALVVFRSVRWIPLLAGSLAVAALTGGVVLVTLFRELHVMTFVMGTTVLGLVVDYSFHWLLSPAAEKARVRRNLAVSFLTTEISLVPLMLSTVPVLRQSAVFLGAGLAAALAYVLVAYPCGEAAERSAPRLRLVPTSWPRAVSVAVFVMLGFGLFRTEVRTEITALYRPSAELLESERQRAAFGSLDLSTLPTPAERRANAEGVRKLYAEHGMALAEALGVRSLSAPPEPTEALLRPQALMDRIFAAWTDEALRRLALSVLALAAVVAWFFRGRALRILAPSALSLLSVAGVLGWTGTPVNLFHVLAAFLVLGMGVDYAVFLHAGGRAALLPALSSLLTSIAGFGALAFVSFPVVASFGVVLGLGLPAAFAAAMSFRPQEERGGVEKAASPLGLECLWLLYRVFGLGALHAAAAAVGVCAWTFSRDVRRASPSVRKVICFTRSLADKLVVMAEGPELPKVVAEGSADAAAFLADVGGGRGVFVLSSHCGTIEMLMALGECAATFHAWTDIGRTSVFNRFYLRHARRPRVVIHPISEVGLGTAFLAGDALERGDSLVMAGDRGRGAFRFAHALGAPVYFVACVWTGGSYRAIVRRLPGETAAMERAFVTALEEVSRAYPAQRFDFR